MKTAEILRKLADLIDTQEETAQPQQPVVVNINNGQAEQDVPTEEIPDELGAMVPPLQQKIELMKKSQGVENVYDQATDNDAEIVALKKNAGIAVLDAEEDEPFEG